MKDTLDLSVCCGNRLNTFITLIEHSFHLKGNLLLLFFFDHRKRLEKSP